MPEQITNTDWVSINKDLTMVRGDTVKLTFAHGLGAAASIQQARFWLKNSAGTVVLALTKAAHASQWDFATTNQGILTIKPDDTDELTVGTYDYAVELTNPSNDVNTPIKGDFTLEDDVVDDDGTAPYLSWTTRTTLETRLTAIETDITQIATAADFSFLAADASASATTITVEDDGAFANGNTIRIVLDAGTYDETTINGAPTANVITLTAALTGAASTGNPVRKM